MFLSAGIALLASCAVLDDGHAGTSVAQSEAAPAQVDPAARRLSEALVANARVIFTTEPLSVEGWSAAVAFLLDAARFDRDREAAWRLLADIAFERDDDALLEASVKRLVALDPQDTSARLTRLMIALDAMQRAPERTALLERLLAPDQVAQIGPDVAAELALHMATLQRQMGQLEEADRWLHRATELNPSSPLLIAMQLGASHGDGDPVVWARHLIALMKANPADRDTAIRLGNLLLEHGDPRGAARFFALAKDLAVASGKDSGADLDADLAMALMLSGRRDDAASVLDDRRAALDAMYQQIVDRDAEERRSPIETARLRAPLTPKLAATALLLAATGDEQAQLDQAAADLVEGLKWNDIQQEQSNQPAGIRSLPLRLGLRMAIAAGVDRVQIEDLFRQIESLGVDVTSERALIDAQAAALGDPTEEGRRPLEGLVESETAASIALASVLEAQGERRAAARLLLGEHRKWAGTFLGALASMRLEALLGQQLPLESPAKELEEATLNVASAWDRYGSESTLAISMRLRPRERSVELYGPLIVDVEIFNHLEVPMAISGDGPISDLVLLQPEVQQPYATEIPSFPIIVDAGRRLRLEPHERLIIPVNLREYWVGSSVDAAVLVGATVEVMGVLNPRMATGPASGVPVPVPGALGMMADSGQIQVQGRRVDPADIDVMCDRLLNLNTDQEVKDMAVLGNLLEDADGTELRAPLTEAQRSTVDAALAEKWPRLSQAQQAWLVTVLPVTEGLGSLGELINASTDSLIQRLVLMRVGSGMNPEKVLDDPRLIAALRSSDSEVYDLATWIESFMRMAAESRLQAPGGG